MFLFTFLVLGIILVATTTFDLTDDRHLYEDQDYGDDVL
jgi:hypothetical protein